MADQVFDMQLSKEEEAGKLYTADSVTIGIPPNAFLLAGLHFLHFHLNVLPLIMAFLISVLRSGFFDKFKSSSSSYAAPPEYSSAYEPPSYGAPPLEGYGPPGQRLDVIVCMIN